MQEFRTSPRAAGRFTDGNLSTGRFAKVSFTDEAASQNKEDTDDDMLKPTGSHKPSLQEGSSVRKFSSKDPENIFKTLFQGSHKMLLIKHTRMQPPCVPKASVAFLGPPGITLKQVINYWLGREPLLSRSHGVERNKISVHHSTDRVLESSRNMT